MTATTKQNLNIEALVAEVMGHVIAMSLEDMRNGAADYAWVAISPDGTVSSGREATWRRPDDGSCVAWCASGLREPSPEDFSEGDCDWTCVEESVRAEIERWMEE